jgi:hypothetical protein
VTFGFRCCVTLFVIDGSKGFGDIGDVNEREALEVLGMALRCWCGVLGLELGVEQSIGEV